MKIVKLPQALQDLIEIGEYIAQDDIEMADRFFDAFEETVEALRKLPKIGSQRQHRTGPVRMWLIKGFERCLIFYSETNKEVVILRIIHASRDYSKFIGE
jgi:toxin ParE1/3/4